MKFVIQGSLPGLNEYTKACRGNAYGANALKKNTERIIALYARQARLKPFTKPVEIKINWFEKNNRRDIDNVVFAKKFILDALVKMHVLSDDSRKFVKEIIDHVETDTENPRIEVEILEVE